MVEVRAADLPEGSIVATRDTVMICLPITSVLFWYTAGNIGPRGGYYPHEVAAMVADGTATVLRHGYGDEVEV